ncbi:Protein ZINC INDUCED FACILITATOR-LIKE 1 [Linum grandiflorum]
METQKEEESGVPLLLSKNNNEKKKKKQQCYHYEDCPGCKVDQLKELKTALPISSLFPYLYFMIRDFNIAEKEEDIGYYSGYVGASFMLGRALTSVLWGLVADRYGRKPVILLGTSSVVILSTLFGLRVNFWVAVITRFLLGCLNGFLGPIKAYATEIFREEHQALGLSTVTTASGIGLIIGPAIGGFLPQISLLLAMLRYINYCFRSNHCFLLAPGNIAYPQRKDGTTT